MTEAEIRAFILAIKRGLALIIAACDAWLDKHKARPPDSHS